MLTYESIFICRPDLPDEKINEIVDKLKTFISQNNGRVAIAERIGKRRLAFRVKRYEEGNYSRIVFEAEPSLITEIEGFYKVNEDIIRQMTVRVQKEKKTKTESKPKAERR